MRRCLALLLCCLLLPAAWAEVAVPALTQRVTDLTQTLAPPQQAALTERLAQLERDTGSQVAVLLVPTTAPETIEQYSIRVAEAWKLGRKGVDDGVLLLVAKDDRKVRIEVGYGLEGALPDVTTGRIIHEDILPAFRNGDFAGGVTAGVERLAKVIGGEPLPPVETSFIDNPDDAFDLVLLVMGGILFAGVILSKVAGGWIGSGGVAGASALATFVAGFGLPVVLGVALVMVIALLIVRSTLFWEIVLMLLSRSGSGGHRIGGGGGGGGFSGGGGGFGGGGASGGW
ncbi:YgcG family protein [Chitiniphilus eburneus]|uniref:YgcG family protein n=2 Tax=Chitiniphilus eburneus TaxID=2571148 RepID=A0A4U0PYF7_9NEIS|nr:YgcG family protein [Chitiniphilus eburneus]